MVARTKCRGVAAERRTMKAPGRSRWIRSSLVCSLVVAAQVSLTACQPAGAGGGAEAPASEEHPLLGASAPTFDLPRIGGSGESPRFRSSDYAGRIVVVDFWATWCAPCRESFPAYEKLMQGREQTTTFVGVSVDESPEGIPAFIEQTGVSFPTVWDEGQAAAAAYEPPTMPTTYVVDQHGIVRFVHVGYRSGDEEQLATVLDGLR